MNVTIFRPFNIYGHGQPASFLIPKIIRQIAADETVELFDPRPKRDYVYVKDVAKALVAGIEKSTEGLNIFNLGSGISHSIPEVIEILEGIFEKKVEVVYLNKFRPDDIMDTICDNSNAKRLLNWAPAITFAAGLKEMVQQYKNQHHATPNQ
jgi:nucleoside-diphosphate-sugar epimerase